MGGKARPRMKDACGLGISHIGLLLVVAHVYHLLQIEDAIALFIGGIIPLGLSIGVVGTGIWVTRSDWDETAALRVVGWLWIGMFWMSIVGIGSILYEMAADATVAHTWFLLAIFATYGSIPGIVTGLYDAQRQRRNQELERQEMAMESAIDGMAILNEEGEFLHLNQAHADIYGYDSPSELVGKSWKTLYDDDETERFESEIMPVLRTTGSFRGRAMGKRRDGSLFPQHVSLSLIEDDGLVCVCRDISDRVDRERAFSVLNRVLRHNLRNEINVIAGQAERIASHTSTTASGAATQICETASDLIGLADKERQIADLVLREPEPEPMDIETVLGHAVAEVNCRYPEAKISCEGGQYPTVIAIPELELALTELLENAIVHNDVETPWVGISITANDRDLTVSIADNGPGIPDQERQVILGERDIDTLFHGSGLGLWYVYWVMRNLGGDIDFADRDPQGSVVTLSLETAGN